jgi:hypothetical protein
LARLASSIQAIQERHQERHRPSGFRFAFADSVDFLQPQHWDLVAEQGGFFLRRDVLRAIETHGAENVSHRYALIYRDAQPVAVLAAQLVSITGKHLRPERKHEKGSLLKQALRPAAKIATSNVRERLLVAGNLFSWGFDGIAFAPGEEPAEIWPGVAEALYRIRRAERLLGQTNVVMVKDVTARQTGLEALRRFSYRPLETEPNMVLGIPAAWRSYDDYLAALDAKYRRNARDQMKKLAEAGCALKPLTETDLATHGKRLHELYLAVHSHSPVRLVTLREGYFAALAAAAGKDFRCTVARRGGEILGFITTIRDGNTALGYYIGFDRVAAAAGLPLYLRLLHTTVADAIAWRCQRLSLGRTALEPKAALGAKPEPMCVWLRHRVPTLNWMMRGLLGAVPHGDAPERSPFKARARDEVTEGAGPAITSI